LRDGFTLELECAVCADDEKRAKHRLPVLDTLQLFCPAQLAWLVGGRRVASHAQFASLLQLGGNGDERTPQHQQRLDQLKQMLAEAAARSGADASGGAGAGAGAGASACASPSSGSGSGRLAIEVVEGQIRCYCAAGDGTSASSEIQVECGTCGKWAYGCCAGFADEAAARDASYVCVLCDRRAREEASEAERGGERGGERDEALEAKEGGEDFLPSHCWQLFNWVTARSAMPTSFENEAVRIWVEALAPSEESAGRSDAKDLAYISPISRRSRLPRRARAGASTYDFST